MLLLPPVDDRPDVHELGIPPALFAQHLQWLERECTLMPLDELLATAPEALPARPVALTFDDGYVDIVEMVAPLLQQRGVPAAFFLTSRWLDEPGEYWWDMLERVLLDAADTPPSIRVAIGGCEETLATADVDGRRRAHSRLHDVMVHASLEQRNRLDAYLRDWSGGSQARVRPMTADELRRVAALPSVAIGAHTVNHLALSDQNAEAMATELSECRARLARVVGRPVDPSPIPTGR